MGGNIFDSSKLKFYMLPSSYKNFATTLELKNKIFSYEDTPTIYDRNLFYAKFSSGYWMYAAYYEEELIGASYVTDLGDAILIDQIFIDKRYQRKGIGTRLLKFILDDKENLEKIFNKKFNRCILRPLTASEEKFYSNVGFSNDTCFMEKAI